MKRSSKWRNAETRQRRNAEGKKGLRAPLIVVLIAVAGCLTGCGPAGFCAGVSYAAKRYHSRDAAALSVKHRPHYRFDTRLRSDLEDLMGLTDLKELKREGTHVLTAAQALAVTAAGGEIARMSPEGIALLARRYPQGVSAGEPGEQREALRERFSDESWAALQTDLAHLQASTDLRIARRMLSDIEKGIEASVADRGRGARGLLTAPMFLPAVIGAEIVDAMATQQVIDASFDHVFIYRPSDTVGARTAEQLAFANDEQLARWFAPVFIQQHDFEAPYPPSEDQFGRVHLTGTPDHIEVQIDIERPTVYWTMQEAKFNAQERDQPVPGRSKYDRFSAMIGAQKRKQIVYAAWYPSRPAVRSGDSEAGSIDGVVIRVTLERHNRPAVYEFVRSCGCYHMLYIAEFVEAAARGQFGEPLPGKRYALQKSDSKRELFIPSLVADDGSHPTRPVAYVSGGNHMLMGIEAGGVWKEGARVISERTYLLKRYETLTQLPLGDGVASMFGSDGLVHNAGRVEGWLFAPTGMRSAGQPRQLGTMKIRMDAYDYDDPYLLDRQLRFPSGF